MMLRPLAEPYVVMYHPTRKAVRLTEVRGLGARSARVVVPGTNTTFWAKWENIRPIFGLGDGFA